MPKLDDKITCFNNQKIETTHIINSIENAPPKELTYTNEIKEHPTKKQKKNRCFICNKKTGCVPFNCKCDNIKLFCGEHRYPEKHNCTFDWKTDGKKILSKKNPKVVCDKFGGNKI